MSKLSELYSALAILRNNNMQVSDDLPIAIEDEEKRIIEDELVKMLKATIPPVVSELQLPFKIEISYQPQKELSVKVVSPEQDETTTVKKSLPIPYTLHKETSEEASVEEEQEETITLNDKLPRRKSIGFKVSFPDGTSIQETHAKDTFIKALQIIGLERISKHADTPIHAGFRLVDSQKREDAPSAQQLIDGFFIYKNLSNEAKIEDLQILSNIFGLKLIITMDAPPTASGQNQPSASEQNNHSESFRTQHSESIPSRQPVKNEEAPFWNLPVIQNFRNYLSKRINPATAKNYIRTLDNAVRQYIAEIIDPTADSIFSYTTPDDVQICIDMLKATPKFLEDNKNRHNAMTAALTKYLEFVRERFN